MPRGDIMTQVCSRALGVAAASALVVVLSAGRLQAAETPDPAPLESGSSAATGGTPPADAKSGDKKGTDTKDSKTKSDEKSSAAPKSDKKSELEFRRGYRHAYYLIHNLHRYKAGIVALHALGHDEHPDVANYLGYANRKLGHYEKAKYWYEKALAADPNHVRTWEYYGLWYLERGNRLKAEDNLEKIRPICGGTGCQEYKDLHRALEGHIAY